MNNIVNQKSKNFELEQKFYNDIISIIHENELDIYRLVYSKTSQNSKLCIFIKQKNSLDGIELKDCVLVDEKLSSYFEKTDWIDSDIILEVSSPGLLAKLTCLQHYVWAKEGNKRLKICGELNSQIINFYGFVQEIDDSNIMFSIDAFCDSKKNKKIENKKGNKKGNKKDKNKNSSKEIKLFFDNIKKTTFEPLF